MLEVGYTFLLEVALGYFARVGLLIILEMGSCRLLC